MSSRAWIARGAAVGSPVQDSSLAHRVRHGSQFRLSDCAGAGLACSPSPSTISAVIKYKEVYLHAYASVSAARAGISRYIQFFNTRHPHSALDWRTPDAVYFNSLSLAAAAWLARRLTI